jgi:hypothetical protein
VIVQPKRPYLAAPPEAVLMLPGLDHGMMIECEVIAPPSAAGRTVFVHVPPEQVLGILRAARDVAAWQRSTPESSSQ